jgi:hypothetical protein
LENTANRRPKCLLARDNKCVQVGASWIRAPNQAQACSRCGGAGWLVRPKAGKTKITKKDIGVVFLQKNKNTRRQVIFDESGGCNAF